MPVRWQTREQEARVQAQGHPTMRICLSGPNNLIVDIRLPATKSSDKWGCCQSESVSQQLLQPEVSDQNVEAVETDGIRR